MLNFIKENTQKLSSSVGSSLGEAQLSRYYNNAIKYIDAGEGQGQPQVVDPSCLTMSDYVQRIINKPKKLS